jgi:Protein of unknown function (DUF2523)
MPIPVALAGLAVLAPTIVPLAVRLLVGVGVGVATYTGVTVLWQTVQDNIWSSLGATNVSVLTIIGMARVDDAIKLVLSAGTTLLLLRGISAATGAVSRWRAGPNPGAFSNV